MKGRLILLAALLLGMALFFQACATTTSPGSLSGGEPPLPAYRIESAPPGTPASVKALLGEWRGSWIKGVKAILVVRKIFPSAMAEVIYAWGKGKLAKPGYFIGIARLRTIKGSSTLEFSRGSRKWMFTLSDGKLIGEYIRGEQWSLCILEKGGNFTPPAVVSEEGLPLPAYYRIEPAPLWALPSLKAILGKWEGIWDDGQDIILVVTKIMPYQKKAEIIYSWGAYQGLLVTGYAYQQADYSMILAWLKVVDGAPRLEFSHGSRKWVFTLSDGKMEGEFRQGLYKSHCTLWKVK